MHYKILSAESVENCREKQHALCIYLSNQHWEAGRGWHPAGVGSMSHKTSTIWWSSNIFILCYYIYPDPFAGKNPNTKNLVEIKSAQDVKVDPYCITHRQYFSLILR